MEKIMPSSKDSAKGRRYAFNVAVESANIRLDIFIAKQFPLYSRSFFKRLLEQGAIYLNGKVVKKAGTIIKLGDEIDVRFPDFKPATTIKPPETINVDILYQQDDFMIISKPAGLIVHEPHPSSSEFTLVDWLLLNMPGLKEIGLENRPGIVHRLDKDTSGLMIIPLTNFAHAKFGDMFKNREISKTYLALVNGHPENEGMIDLPIMRHPKEKHKMSCNLNFLHPSRSRKAVTKFRVLKYFNNHSLVEVKPLTGRTHQIRVHLASLKTSIVGDGVYGEASQLIGRHALHASEIAFEYNGKPYHFAGEPPDDFKNLIECVSK